MTNKANEKRIEINNNHIIREIFGEFDEKVDIIKEKLNIDVMISNGDLRLYGESEAIDLGEKLIYNLIEIINQVVCVTASGKSIKPKTLGQKRYLDSIKNNDIVFGIGPAGTGKTFLAMAMAVQAFKNKEVNRIILTRPAVEAGENLGFLPGDLQEKVDPYLRPIYDALFEILGYETYEKYVVKGLIEVAPLAYMRGRTLDSSYVILDEAQNTTNEQMKMFLTRLGFGSKAIITGDITQIDLPRGKQSGLKTVSRILEDIQGIDFIYLTKYDIVRHPLVQKIIEAYERNDNKQA